MRYIDVEWIHDNDDYPVRLVSEIAPDNFEMRKLEIFRNGKVGYAYADVAFEGTMLGHVEVPSIAEIDSQNEFQDTEISKKQLSYIGQSMYQVTHNKVSHWDAFLAPVSSR